MSSLVGGAADIVSKGVTSALALLTAQGLRSDDDLFVSQSVYFFELRLPMGNVGTTQNKFYFPLALNPEMLSISEPFTVDATPTLGGGLCVEESGIIQRTIRIRGTTGAYQRPFAGNVNQLDSVSDADKSFGRTLEHNVLGILSGQKIFQYLQDAVFRLYAEKKRDPNTAAGTALIFHMPREKEAWEVVPTHFGNDRTAARPLDYPYEIELLVVQKGEATANKFSEDKPVLDALKDPLAVAANYLQRATAAVNALTAAQGELRNYFRKLDVILVQANSVIGAVSAFVQGTAGIINIPADTVRVLASTIQSSVESFVASSDGIKRVPQVYEQSLRQLEGACYYLLVHPSSFAQANAAAKQAAEALRAYQAAVAAQEAQQAQAAASAALGSVGVPKTLAAASKLGTSLTPEQIAEVKTSTPAGAASVTFTGSHPYRVQAGDTLSNIAARYLGDARLWRYVAALNNLKPPYTQLQATLPLTAKGIPSTVTTLPLGSVILIPDFSSPQSNQTDLATLGVSPDAPLPDRVFGTDFVLTPSPAYTVNRRTLGGRQKLDWVIDTTSGGTGLKTAAGLDNLAQAVLTRVSLTRGEDPLYQGLGVDPVVTSGYSDVDAQTLAFSLKEALTQDPRISQVDSLSVTDTPSGDGVVLQGKLQARLFADPIPLSIPLTGTQTG